MIILDTSVVSLAFRRRSPKAEESKSTLELRRLINEDMDLGIPGIVLQELLAGVKARESRRALDNALSAFPLLLASRRTHVRAATIANACIARGIAVTATDCLIAAHAVLANAALFSVDRDFDRMAAHCGLRLHRIGR